MKRLLFSIILALPVLLSSSQEKRLALIIGNGDYHNTDVLQNPVNDARAIRKSLEKIGFDVVEYENLEQKDMRRVIDDFGIRLKGYDVGLFFYAGHGVQANGYNYLIPVDALLRSENDVEYDCVRANRILSKMEDAGTTTNLVILDACRDNPFERSWSRGASGKGLAFMNAPTGSLIAYSTSPGFTAFDGTGENGLYTSALLKHIDVPNITALQMFQKVRTHVRETSNNQQVPWESTSLEGDFYFRLEDSFEDQPDITEEQPQQLDTPSEESEGRGGNVLMLHGKIYDSNGESPIMAKIEIIDLDLDQVIATTVSNPGNGSYSINFKERKEYAISISATDYIDLVDFINLNENIDANQVLRNFDLMQDIPSALLEKSKEEIQPQTDLVTKPQENVEKEEEPIPVELISVKGTITNAITGSPIEANIQISKVNLYEIIDSAISRKEDGNYQLIMQKEKKYRIEISANGYYPLLEIINSKEYIKNDNINRDYQLYALSAVVPKNEIVEESKPAQTISSMNINPSSKQNVILMGDVRSAHDETPIMATIKILNVSYYEIIDSTLTNIEQGKYSLELTKGDKYRIEISAENFYPHLTEIKIPKSLSNKRITRNFQLFKKGLETGVKMNLEDSSFIDLRDNNVYHWAKMGDQIWMTENLNYFPEKYVSEISWCYQDNELYCNMYGKLYVWEIAKKACPKGWHLPSDEEWLALEKLLSDPDVNLSLKDDWDQNYGIEIRDLVSSGFNPIAGGRRLPGGVFDKMGESGFYWASSRSEKNNAWYRELNFKNQRVRDTQSIKRACSVRCIKDTE